MDVHQKTTQSSSKPLKGTKFGGVKKAKNGNKKQIERWNFFDPTAAFVNGIQSDARKPNEVEKITCYCKLIGKTRGVYFQYHTYNDKYDDQKKYQAIMLVNQYTIPKDQLKDPIDDDVSFLKKKIIFVYDFF